MSSHQQEIIIEPIYVPLEEREVEMCEHKGIGHPDTIADGVCEAASRELSRAYLQQYGRVMHHNVDKGLLVAGRSEPRFGGGSLLEKMKIIVCGRATQLADGLCADERVKAAVRHYLLKHIRCDLKNFEVLTELHEGSPNLKEVFAKGNAVQYANDTSFACGYAPYSKLEKAVLELAKILKSDSFRRQFPVAGDDFKVMGHRIREEFYFTLALAFVDSQVENTSHYFEIKKSIHDDLIHSLEMSAVLHINTLDDEKAKEEQGLYLTVTGLSAEMGDDGQVGRGNRVNGLITPCRAMSLEAAAGKNPTNHVGKIYNVLAHRMARQIVEEMEEVEEVAIKILSAIGQALHQPQLVSVELRVRQKMTAALKERIQKKVLQSLEHVSEVGPLILEEKVGLY